ncbi:histone deacetylase [Nocardiopsis gilva YIM 90087]|uniref:Histone deacetylase n=1 Tax=Nocardiopsis gilva YIM 90087 TaxID=1235441 RepID=A0A223S7A3_9ACTN|nr:hypothetical protein [Nocardiopsis gilva]ASU83983.1 histone deacetylase [Nocardiopsis gilva YIM 90087]
MRAIPAEPAAPDQLVWYASYGSNMAADRFGYYLAGGSPPDGARTNPGCRDRTPPRSQRAVWLNGGVYFALTSRMWGGGLALLDPSLPGAAPARAYLLTAEQFSDVAAQEMYRDPGAELGLDTALRKGRDVLGEGRYETLVYCGRLDGHPVLTFTARWSRPHVPVEAPAASYLRLIGGGLRETHGWAVERTAAHLAHRPGARGAWTSADVATLLSA